MKKFLLIFWNIFCNIRIFLRKKFDMFKDSIYVKRHPAPQIMSCEDTVDYILEHKCCVSRFGDAEVKLLCGRDVCYQVSTPEIREHMNTILASDEEKLLVCLPSVFSDEQLSNRVDSAFWKEHLSYSRKYWYQNLIPGKVYGNAFISRNYLALKVKDDRVGEYFKKIRTIWEDRDIIVVEGEKSRLGMGNDLFDNAKSVRRILGPSDQSFSKYNEVLAEIKKHSTDNLFLLAMGPTATILPLDLYKLGYQAIDIGNIDTEYEWYLRGATKKIPIENKMVYEAGKGEGVGEATDEKYLSQIIAKVL